MSASQREDEIVAFLNQHGHGDSQRRHLTGDASTRAYEYIVPQGNAPTLILMNAPPQPDGPPIKDGKPYSQIAHLAEDMGAFVGVAQRLTGEGFRAPEIHAHDLQKGLLLIEDLGADLIIDAERRPIVARYMAAMETLAEMHERSWAPEVSLPDNSTHRLPPYDRDAVLIEVDLLAQWYAPYKQGQALSDQQLRDFGQIWDDLFGLIDGGEKSIVLRDYHSPNIIWQEGAQGVDRTGLIDFQDALIGPSAYDVASIAQDARIALDAELESALIEHYLAARSEVDAEALRQMTALMAAQRATKVLGIFVRLSQRDGKHGYLGNLPHVETYLKRALQHPALSDYRRWVASELGL